MDSDNNVMEREERGKRICKDTYITLRICLDGKKAGRWNGRLYNQLDRKYSQFFGTSNLADQIARFQSRCRTSKDLADCFDGSYQTFSFHPEGSVQWQKRFLYQKRGAIGSLYVHILFRKNEKTAGRVLWITGGTIREMQCFLGKTQLCSVLEDLFVLLWAEKAAQPKTE